MNNTNNINSNNIGFDNLKKTYDNLTYFDQYGSSVIMLIIITFVLIVAVSYCHIMINSQPILDDWPNQRCKPQIIPIAGFITHPEGVSATEYTSQNFSYCTQNILTSITGDALKPLTAVTGAFQTVVSNVSKSINSIRAMFDKISSLKEVANAVTVGLSSTL